MARPDSPKWGERAQRHYAGATSEDPVARAAGTQGLVDLYREVAEYFEADPEAPYHSEAGGMLLALCQALLELPEDVLPPDLAGDAFLEYGIDVAARLHAADHGAVLATHLTHRLRDRGELARSEEAAGEALEAFSKANGPARPLLHALRAELARERRDLSAALEEIDSGERLLDDGPEYDDARLRLAGARLEVHLRQGRLDSAAMDVEVIRRLGDAPGLRKTALLYWLKYGLATENYQGIARRIAEARDAKVEGLDRPHVAAELSMYEGVALSELARAGRGDTRSAQGVLLKGLDQDPAPKTRASTELVLAELALRSADLEGARGHLESVARQLASEGRDASPHHTGELASLRSQLAFAEEADAETLATCQAALVVAFEGLLESWSKVPTTPGGIGFLHHGNRRRVVSELVRTSLALTGPGDAVSWLLQAQQQSTLVRRLDAPPVDLDEIRRALLDENVGILAYLPSLDRSHVLAIDREQVLHVELPAIGEIDPLRQDLQAKLFHSPAGLDEKGRSRRARDIRRLGRQLADMVLPPAIREHAGEWSEVIVVGEELLGNLPFEALCLHPEADAPLLGTEWVLSSLPSLPLGCFLEERRMERAAGKLDIRCILVAAPELGLPEQRSKAAPPPPFADELRALPALDFGESERAALTTGFGAERVQVLAGREASLDALRAAALPRARVLEFLAHTLHDPQRERTAALVLAPGKGGDRLLRCEGVEELNSPPLVVLFSCATARAASRPGDAGANQLGSAFLVAGAQCVVSSRAPLAYDAVLALGSVFHARLAEGDSPAAALREARRALAQEAATDDPFYWATIQAVGLGHRPVF